MKIRAKFACSSVTKDATKNETVTLHPVYGPDGSANREWSRYTPSGRLEMTITAEGAQGQFVPGKEYFLDITPAEEDAPTTQASG